MDLVKPVFKNCNEPLNTSRTTEGGDPSCIVGES